MVAIASSQVSSLLVVVVVARVKYWARVQQDQVIQIMRARAVEVAAVPPTALLVVQAQRVRVSLAVLNPAALLRTVVLVVVVLPP
jgi:hypothetical protein